MLILGKKVRNLCGEAYLENQTKSISDCGLTVPAKWSLGRQCGFTGLEMDKPSAAAIGLAVLMK